MSRFIQFPIISFCAFTLFSCGSSDKSSNPEADSIAAIVLPTLTHGNATKQPTSIDSLALFADDLSIPQGIAVLIAYSEIEADAVNRRLAKTAMETRRKFVDVYDILLSNNGSDFRKALERTIRSNNIDLRALADSFRTRLSGYDESAGLSYISDIVETPDTARRDTATTIAPADSIQPSL